MKTFYLNLPTSETRLTMLGNISLMPRQYPREIRIKARKLVRMGIPKTDVSKILGVGYITLYMWTRDMRGQRGRNYMSGMTLDFLRTIVRKGYILSSEVKTMTPCMRTLGKYLPIRRVSFLNRTIWFLDGREREAMEGLLKIMNRRVMSYHDLGRMRRIFGIKNIKRNNKIL